MSDPYLKIKEHLEAIYGEDKAGDVLSAVVGLFDKYTALKNGDEIRLEGNLTEKDAVLITYGDQLSEPGIPPLRALNEFAGLYLRGLVSTIHILPFYPYTSDDGFSVSDYRSVDPALGTWEDINSIGKDFRLMFDAVINHVSTAHAWFTRFLNGNPEYNDYFIEIDVNADLTGVVRPRALPLLTDFDTPGGKISIWTTFSADQVDLNYANPAVLVEILDTLLFYDQKGCSIYRLDAIAYLWKEIGTSCINLPQTHRIIQLIRLVLELVNPGVYLVTETNVPHSDNIFYFGDGSNEASLVYNFALPPLVLHTLQSGSARRLTGWATTLSLPSNNVTFFNFLASHDGIGLNPVRGILNEAEIEQMVACALNHGGLVSFKDNPDGSRSVYEININYYDAVNDPQSGESLQIKIDRFMASQAIMLSLAGVPGIYFHSMFGSRGWPEGVKATGRNRSINRQKLELAELENELNTLGSFRQQIFTRYKRLLEARRDSPAFSPAGCQIILDVGEGVFSLLRGSPDGKQTILCLQNITGKNLEIQLPASLAPGINTLDIITGLRLSVSDDHRLCNLAPYQTLWLKI